MAEIRIIDNTTRPAGAELLAGLEQATQVRIATAFAKASGVTRLWDAFKRVLSDGGQLHVVYGLDFHITDPEAMERFRELADDYPETLTHHAFSEWGLAISQTFHPKLYICTDAAKNSRVIVGSSNLTHGGLWENNEANATIVGSESEPVIVEAQAVFKRISSRSSLFVPNQEYIDRYRTLHRRAASARLTLKPPRRLSTAYEELKDLEERLPGPTPTQKRLVIQAIKNLSADNTEFVHWTAVESEAERLARAAGVEFAWYTFGNSVRGRLNRDTEGKNGDDLFERCGGVQGRQGLYRLTKLGQQYQGR